MLELLEVVDGAILITVYLAFTLFVPLAFFAAAAAIVGTVLRIPLSAIPGLRGERGARSHPLVAAVRLLIVGAIPLAIGAAAVLAGLDRLSGGTSTDVAVALAGGLHAVAVVLLGVQDGGFRAWTGLAPNEVIARVGAADGAGMLAVFARLVGTHLAAWAGVTARADTVRAVFDGGVALVATAAMGVSPLRGIRASRAARADFSSRAWSIGSRESE